MMDQLASIGVAFHEDFIEHIFDQNSQYYLNQPKQPTTNLLSLFSRRPTNEWAVTPVYEEHKPVRPFGFGEVYNSETGFYVIAGKIFRSPGLYMRVDPDTGTPTNIPMTNTNERIHPCVRIRFELGGLGLDDMGLYKTPALLKNGPWVRKQVANGVQDPIPWNASWGPEAPAADAPPGGLRWVWEYAGPEHRAPTVRTLVEENLGPYQRKLLLLTKDKDIFHRVVGSPDKNLVGESEASVV
jgi:hypothetical protein